jgi:hypothetical protein
VRTLPVKAPNNMAHLLHAAEMCPFLNSLAVCRITSYWELTIGKVSPASEARQMLIALRELHNAEEIPVGVL